MIRNKLGLPARSLMVAVAVAWWVPSGAAGVTAPVQSPPTKPQAPQNLLATLDGSSVYLTWTAPELPGSSSITGYLIELYYRDLPLGWIQLEPNTRSTATNYRHRNPPQGTTVYYRVAAINAAGPGDYSIHAEVITPGSTGTPSEPLNLQATIVGAIATLTWEEPDSDGGSPITGYEIHVSADQRAWTRVAEPPATATSHVGPAEVGVVSTVFRVRAVNANGVGIPEFVDATTGSTGTTPSAPLNLTAVAAGPNIIDVDWDAPASPGASAIIDYQVEVSATGGVPWTPLTTTSQTSFRHTSLTAGVIHHYQVRARNAFGFGPWTSPEYATTGTPPGPPRALTATAVSSSAIDLSWSAPLNPGSSAITGYRIEWSSTRTGGWSDLEDDTGNTRTTYQDTGLAPNTTRYYRVSAINSFGTGVPSNVEGAITEQGVPDAPGRLTAQARGISVIELDWTRPSSSGTSPVTGYQIQWSSTGTGRWTDLEDDTGNTRTTYDDTGLPPNTTRYYRVRAISRAGPGAWSNVAHATTDDLTVPGVPTGLTVTPNRLRGSTELLLTWRAPASNGGSPITGYRIERAITRGGPWIIQAASTGSATTSYTHTGLAPNTTRFYRVFALNAQGQGPPSTAVPGTTNAAPPGQPRNLRAQATGPTTITLAWDAPASDGGERINGYTIQERGPNDGTWITIERNTGSNATTYTRPGLQPASAYRYRVAAINRVGAGQWSFETSTSTYPEAPGAPPGLTARAVGTSRIDLSWSAPRNTGGAPILAYRIEAWNDAIDDWRTIRRHPASAGTTFSDLNLQPATTRRYRVAATNTAGTGPYSNIASATTEATVPGAPRNLDAEADGTSRIELSWSAPTSDGGERITGYRIEVSDDGGGRWEDLVSNTRNTRTTHVDPGLAPATTRHYRVSAINREGVGRASRVASATTDATVPDAPTGLVATAVTPTQIDLFWLAPAYDGGAPITGYRIEVSKDGGVRWEDLVPNTGSRATAFPDPGLLPGTTRHYRVSAINREGPGAPSASASASTDDPVQRAGRLNTRVLPHVASAMTSSTVSAIARRVDAVANGMGMERRVETNGLSSMAASLSAPDAGGLGLAQGDQAGLAALFGGTSFTMPFGASGAQQQSATGTQLARLGLTAEGRGRFVISARAGYQEWGIGGTLMFDPATRGQGLSIRMAPSYGNHLSGVNQLWERGVNDAVGGRELDMGPNVDGEVAYRIAGFQGTPYGGFYLGQGGTRAFSSGVRYELGAGVGLRVEGTRRESTLGAPQHTVGVRGRLRFR